MDYSSKRAWDLHNLKDGVIEQIKKILILLLSIL